MTIVLEEQVTPLQRGVRNLCRRVYLSDDGGYTLPTDSAPGSIALCKEAESLVSTYILFPDGYWGKL